MSIIFAILSLVGSCAALTAAANPVDFRVPLAFASDGTLFVNTTVPGTDGAPRLQVVARHGFGNRYQHGSRPIIHTSTSDVPLLELEVSDPVTFRVRFDNDLFSRHTSEILDQVGGALAVIKSNQTEVAAADPSRAAAELIFGSTLENFVTTCVPGTLASFPSRNRPATFKITNETTGVVIEEYPVLEIKFKKSDFSIAQITNDMQTRMQQIMMAQGCVLELPRSYSSCTRRILHALPKLEFQLPQGTLTLFPDDYIDFGIHDTCVIKIQTIGTIPALELSPLSIPGTNVRISHGGNVWHICESAAIL